MNGAFRAVGGFDRDVSDEGTFKAFSRGAALKYFLGADSQTHHTWTRAMDAELVCFTQQILEASSNSIKYDQVWCPVVLADLGF